MSKPITFMFDYASPWAYLADAILERELPGAEITYQPIYLRGLEMFSTAIPYGPAKLRYITRDWLRCCEHYGVPARLPDNFPVNGLYSLRGALHTLQAGGFERYHKAVFASVWSGNGHIGDKNNVIDLAVEAGLDRQEFAAGIEDPVVKQELKDVTAAAEEKGVFGVPTFYVGDDEGFYWGHDRMDYIARAAGLI